MNEFFVLNSRMEDAVCQRVTLSVKCGTEMCQYRLPIIYCIEEEIMSPSVNVCDDNRVR